MPTFQTHSLYDAYLPIWDRVADAMAGADQVKAAKEKYLPMLFRQEDDDYKDYLYRAVFYNATGRTAEALAGFIFRKPPTYKVPLSKEWTQDVDMGHTTIEGYARKVVSQASSIGRCGTLIDYDAAEGRPYFAFFLARDIVNWRYERVGGRMMLTALALQEWEADEGGDEFAPVIQPKWLVYRLEAGGVTRETYRAKLPPPVRGKRQTAEISSDEDKVIMTRRNAPLDEIPFVFHNSDEPGPCISKPPLADIASVNIAHFCNSADMENGLHICGVPTPIAIGFGTKKTLYLGSRHAWATDQVGASASFLEFTGQGLTALATAMADKERQMAALGARLVEPRTKDAESTETVMLRAAAETSTLARVGLLTSEGISEILQWAAWWAGTKAKRAAYLDTAYLTLNQDYVSARLGADEITALMLAWQQGGISQDALFYNFTRGELYEPGTTIKEEQRRLAENPAIPPVSSLMTDGTPIFGQKPPDLAPPVDPNKPAPVPPKKTAVPAKKAAVKK